MSNLVPEKRLDKNNKLVTKYVRNGKTPWTQAPLPAPSTKTLSNLGRLRQEVKDLIETHVDSGLMSTGFGRFFKDGVALADEETASVVKEFVNSEKTAHMAMRLIADFSKQPQTIREVIFYLDSMPLSEKDMDAEVNYIDEMAGQVQGIHKMKDFEHVDDLTKLPPQERVEVSALIQVGWAVYKAMGNDHPALDPACKYSVGSGPYNLWIVDDALIEFTKKHAERAASVCELIQSRRTLDLEWIEEALTITPSLVEGSL